MKQYFLKPLLLLTAVLTIGSTTAHAQLKTVTRGFGTFGLEHLQPYPAGDLDNNISFTTEQNLSESVPSVNSNNGFLILYPGVSGTENGGNSLVLTPKNNVVIIEVSLIIRTGGTFSQNAVYKEDGGAYQVLPSSPRIISDIQAEQQVVITNSDTYGRTFGPTSITVTYLEGAAPLLITGAPLSFSVLQGADSPVKSLRLRAYNLTPAAGDITLALPANFEAAVDGGAYTAGTLNLPYTGGALNKTMDIRLTSTQNTGSYDGALSITGGGLTPGEVALTGSVMSQTTVTVTDDSKVNVSNLRAGSLQDALTGAGIAANGNITELTASGHINAADFGYLRTNYRGKITKIDLSAIAAIEAYSGTAGPGSTLVTDYPEGELPYRSFYQYGVVTSTVLPENGAVTSIGEAAFFANLKLTSVNIPGAVKTIKNGAFQGTYELAALELPSGLEWLGGTNTFNNARALTTLEIPAGTKIIANANGEYVLNNTFVDAASLTSVNIPSNVTAIGALTFCRSGITSIEIPEGVTSIETNAFLDAVALQTIDLPGTLVNIGNTAFSGAAAVETIIARNPEPIIFSASAGVFNGIKKGSEEGAATLYVPAASIDPSAPGYNEENDYSIYDLWKDFMPNIKAIELPKQAQNIENFVDINKTTSDDDFELAATATSGLAITYTITEGNGTVAGLLSDGKTVSIKGVGNAKIKASQAGNEEWEPAEDVEITLTVTQGAGLWDTKNNAEFILQGNPVVNEARFSFESAGSGASIVIVDLAGKTVATENIAAGATEAVVNISSLPKGMYISNYADNAGRTASLKIVK